MQAALSPPLPITKGLAHREGPSCHLRLPRPMYTWPPESPRTVRLSSLDLAGAGSGGAAVAAVARDLAPPKAYLRPLAHLPLRWGSPRWHGLAAKHPGNCIQYRPRSHHTRPPHLRPAWLPGATAQASGCRGKPSVPCRRGAALLCELLVLTLCS